MGAHLDRLIDVLKSPVRQTDASRARVDADSYLREVVEGFCLYEFPLKKADILPQSGKEISDYHRYLQDYVKMSSEYGKFFVTPHERTAIEDPESVVFLEHLDFNRYRVTNFCNGSGSFIQIGNVKIEDRGHPTDFFLRISPLYAAQFNGLGVTEIDVLSDSGLYAVSQDLSNAAMAHMQETVYIMDPENFIIRVDTPLSQKEDKRRERKKNKQKKNQGKLRKTDVRPKFICLDYRDTVSFLRGESKEPRAFHVVRGYWKTLLSERYKKARGRVLHIAQYNRGKGNVIGRGNKRYQVFVKNSLVDIQPAD